MSTNEKYSYLCDVISLLDMLQELKIKNFKSFRDEVVLSFETSGNDKYNSVVTMPDGVQLLRFAVVLGANASGKSNLLEAIDFLRVFWNKIPMKNDEGTDVQPFLMQPDALKYDTEFDVKLYVNGIRYWYQLVVNPEKVCSEVLYVYLSNRPTKVFTREDVNGISKLTFNPALDDMRRWIDSRMMPLINGSDTAISDTTKNMLSEDSTFKEYLMHFVKEADFNISDIKIKKMAALFGHKVETERGEEDYVLPENSQSAGTTRMVELESIIYSQLKCQGLLCVDELEASIHPNLMEYMLTRFVNKKDNQSQLIVTTHYDPILRDIDDIFGKDSVWFTEKGKDGNSNLFSLVEFRGLNKLSSIHRAYMNGQFGALPNIIM